MVENDASDRRTVRKLAGLAAATTGGIAGIGTATTDDEDAAPDNVADDGLVAVEGGETVAETVDRIEAGIEEGDRELPTTIDHGENAAAAGE